MKNWEEKDGMGICKSAQDYEDVVQVCNTLDIPYYTVDFTLEYRKNVFEEFLQDCKMGLTPNPDVLCNREIKFKTFFEKAMELDADFLATGHYCQTDDQHQLLKGMDPEKDQSYFLYAIKSETLKKVLFPIGHLQKSEVRRMAKEANLHLHAKKDSTGICFIGKRNFKEFVSGFLGFSPGNFENLGGEILGQHDGLAYYTIGQRKGMGFGGEGEPWYVVAKDRERNVVIIDRGKENSALFFHQLIAHDFSWISGTCPDLPFSCRAKIRYRQQDQSCIIHPIENGQALVVFTEAQRAITPGQAIVFYDGAICLGGAKIKSL